jgi:Xaa-Pro aminopeptidase
MNLAPIDHKRRLERLMEELGAGAFVAPSQPEALRNANVEHVYRQESFLHYLIGFDEPHAALVVLPFKPAGQRVHLFLRDKNPERELWEGRRLGLAGAKATLPIDEAHDIAHLWDRLPGLLGEAERVHYSFGICEQNDRHLIQALAAHKAAWGRRKSAAKLPVYDAAAVAGRLRLQKDAAEIARLRGAAAVTRATFEKIYQTTRPGMSERDVHGLILGEFLRGGGEMEAYGSIVAGGANACVLHYRGNDQKLVDGELLLVDAGAQYQYYASDVTRTFPIGKRFTPEQKALYEVVLAAQKAAIAVAKPGSSLNAVHDEATLALIEGLVAIGLLRGSKDEILESKSYRRFYPHNTSHWIGLDVHDVGLYHDQGKPVALVPGMYFSVEPGLYVDPTDTLAPAAFRGIGIRIEDDVLVTETGNEVLTGGIAKEVAQLENRY